MRPFTIRRTVVIMGALLVVSGCMDRLLMEPSRLTSAAVSLSLSHAADSHSSPGWSDAYYAADRIWVELSRGGAAFHEQTVTFAPGNVPTALSLEVELEADTEEIGIAFELRNGADQLFRGDTTVVAEAGGQSDAPVTLSAVAARVVVNEADPRISLGDTATVGGVALFATGDTITTDLNWAVLDSAVLALLPDGRIHAIGLGEGRLTASYLDWSDTTTVSVFATARLSVSGSYPQDAPSGWGAAYESTDQLSIRLSRAGTPFHEQTTAFTFAAVALEIELLSAEEEIGVEYELRRGADPLFRGGDTVAVSAGASTEASVSLDAVAATISTQRPESLATVGDTLPLAGEALFATGDTVTAALAWEVVDPAVLALTAGGDAVAVGPGAGRVVGSAAGLADTVEVGVALAVQRTVVSGADSHGCLVTDTRSIQCWGYGLAGQLGNGETPTHALSPVHVASAEEFISVTTGWGSHSCGLNTVGEAFCWGSNHSGQLGIAGGGFRSTPVAVEGEVRFGAIAAGERFTCGLALDGAAYCWGSNSWGRLGDGTLEDRAEPTAVSGGRRYVAIAAGVWHACAVESGGATWCWGYNRQGQLGDGGTTDQAVPVAVTGGFAFERVAAGSDHSCGLTGEGEAFCWGQNVRGSLGDGTTTNRFSPVAVATTTRFTSIVAAASHTCASALEGQLYCWGWNREGQLGDSTRTTRTTPAAVTGSYSFAAAAAGRSHTCGVTMEGQTYCWGSTVEAQLGNGALGFRSDPGLVSGNLTFSSISRGYRHTCGIATEGTPYCWGSNVWGGLGDGNSGQGDYTLMQPTPVRVSGQHVFSQISAGNLRSCALTPAGAAWCWGGDVGGVPMEITVQEPFSSISTGIHTCALGESGTAYCWGQNQNGQLGDGTTTESAFPVRVAGELTFTRIVASWNHTCGIVSSGAMYCWGWNAYGQLGDGSTSDRTTPVQVSGALAFSEVSASPTHTCALDTNGSAHCWGRNSYNQLGTGGGANQLVPAPVASEATFSSISSGGYVTCARQVGGAAYCWGPYTAGELGAGDYTGYGPVMVAGGHSWANVDASYTGGCGVTTAGAGYCWGDRAGGILGDGTTAYQLTPALVQGATAALPGQDP